MRSAVLIPLAAMLAACGTTPADGHAAAEAACNSWETVVAGLTASDEQLNVQALDDAVRKAREAADQNGKYTELWKALSAYQIIVTSGTIDVATYPTDGGTHACASI
jgi:hypothetical protein